MKKCQVFLKIAFVLTAVLFLLCFSGFVFLRMQEPEPVEADFGEIRAALSEAGLDAPFMDGSARIPQG